MLRLRMCVKLSKRKCVIHVCNETQSIMLSAPTLLAKPAVRSGEA